MKKLLWAAILVVSLAGAPATFGQAVQVNRDNRTVAVTVTENLEVQPELGVVQIGYHNYGRAKDDVYEENGRVAGKIIDALLGAGVKKEDIQTETVQLGRVENMYPNMAQKQDKEQQFEGQQTWKVRVPAGEVQKVVDHAVAAGANDIQNVEWEVADSKALDAKARMAAIAKARGVAEEMAKALNGKVGGLLFVSNDVLAGSYLGQFGRNLYMASSGQTISVNAARLPVLNLFPQKVRAQATVYAVFALE
jgi:uncharacterized protein